MNANNVVRRLHSLVILPPTRELTAGRDLMHVNNVVRRSHSLVILPSTWEPTAGRNLMDVNNVLRRSHSAGQPGHFTKHLRTHSGERPYECKQCDKTFTHSGDSITHLRTRSGKIPYAHLWMYIMVVLPSSWELTTGRDMNVNNVPRVGLTTRSTLVDLSDASWGNWKPDVSTL